MPKPPKPETLSEPRIEARPYAQPARSLGELVEVIGQVRLLGPDSMREVPVRGFTHDSRSVRPGDLYAAFQGATANGAVFA